METVRALLVGVPDGVAADLADAGIEVESVDSSTAAAARLGDASAGPIIHCVVGWLDGTEPQSADAADQPTNWIPERTIDWCPRPPLVFAGEEPLAAVASRVVAAGAEEYVSLESADQPSSLLDTVATAGAEYQERLDRARVSRDAPDPGMLVRDGVIAVAAAGLDGRFAADAVEDVSLASLVAEPDRDAVADALTAADEDPTTLRVTPNGDRHRTTELRLRRSPIDGAVVGTARDVTDDEHERRAMQEAAAQLDSLLQNIPMSIYFKDELGRHERVSDYITQTDPDEFIKNDEGKVHPHPDDVIGKTDFDLYAPSFAEQTYEDDMRVIEDEERIVNYIEPGTTNLGEPLYTSTTKVPRYDQAGNVVGLVGVSIDVTERVTHREELERQNERLNEFAEVLTHDLRNPLNIANGYLDILEESYDETAVDEVSSALDRMESLIEEIRAFVLEGRRVEEPDAVDLREAAQEAWSTVDTGEATLEFEGSLCLQADRARLRRLLENLFRNAVQHGRPPDDSDGLTIRVVGGDHQFSVEDDGVGIPLDVADEVFERGYTTSDDGTGFGLAIVESIADAHGWSVTMGECDMGGARFVFSDVVHAETGIGRTIA